MITVVLRQHVRLDWRNNVVYRGVIHAVRKAEPGKGRSMCGRYGPRHGHWEVATAYAVTCVVCLRKLANLPYHGNKPCNQYAKERRQPVNNDEFKSALLNAQVTETPVYTHPRFYVADDGHIMAVVHHNDKSDENIAAIIDLGDATQLAADAAERGVLHEAGVDRTQLYPTRVSRKLKRIREALGFTY